MFKAGDKVKIKRACSGTVVGEICTLYKKGGELWAKGKASKYGGCNCQEYWKKVSSPKEIPVKYVVVYDERNNDPTKEFYTRKELVNWLEEAKENEDINFGSIKIYLVSGEFKATAKVNISLRKKR